MRRYSSLGCLILLAAVSNLAAQETLPPNTKLKRVEVRPSSVELKTPFEYRQLLLTGVLDNGDLVDVTRQAQFTAPATVIKVSANGQVRPVSDGQGEITFLVH